MIFVLVVRIFCFIVRNIDVIGTFQCVSCIGVYICIKSASDKNNINVVHT